MDSKQPRVHDHVGIEHVELAGYKVVIEQLEGPLRASPLHSIEQ